MPPYTKSILNSAGLEFHIWPGASEDAATFFGISHTAIIPSTSRRVIIGGQVGIKDDGTVPSDIFEEIDVAFEHVERALKAAGLPDNAWEFVFKVRTFEVPADDLPPAVKKAANRYLGETRPVWTGVSIAGLFMPNLHI